MKFTTGATLILLAGLVWSTQGLIIRNIHESGAWTVLFWRSLGTLAVMLLWIWLTSKGQLLREFKAAGFAAVVGGIGLVLAFGGAIYSLQATSVANAVLLFSASPFFAAILGRLLLHEAVAPLTWLSMALAACGVLVMVDGSIGRGAVDGNLAALISAFGFGSFTVALRWGKVANMFPAVAMGALLSVATGAVVALALGQALLVPTHDIVVSIGMGVVTLAGGLLLYTAGSRVVPAAQATLLSMTEILLAPVWVWLALGETVSQATATGGAILLVAVLINAFGGRKPRLPARA
ncbi:MAG: DMT family transporter [Cypionkella sp.]|nr:DMT family transporter [Cypionkella sp.]